MSKNHSVGTKVLVRFLFSILITVSGLASCGGGVGSTAPANNGTAAVSLQLHATPSYIVSGNTATVAWTSANTTSCTTAIGELSGSDGSFDTPPLINSTTYTVTCSGPTGTATQVITVNVGNSGECNDGIDNDGDGLIDWQMDLGCENDTGISERADSRAAKNGFSTFDPDAGSFIIFVSNSTGNDSNNGLSPQTAVKTITRGVALIRSGQYDFLLLKRGDVWRDQNLGRFKSGRDAAHPLVVASYGTSTQRPRLETVGNFIDQGGAQLDNVAILGLEFFDYANDPNDPAFTGTSTSGLSFVGHGSNLLIEDNKFTYGELVFQSYNPGGINKYRNVEIRRNVVTLAYHTNTCGQNQAYRPSGTYTSLIDGLLIEGNVYDHNGWNERVSSACATMYNHNMYLNANDLVVKDNLITRGSSMGIKTVSNSTDESKRLLLQNNFIYDGEIGISAGGNTAGPYRYTDVTVRGNVFAEIGKSNNTGRNFSWALDLSDNDRALVENNYFLNQPWHSNSYGISIVSPTFRDATIRANTFYNINGSAIVLDSQSAWSNIKVTDNRFLAPPGNACMVQHTGNFSAVTYSNNQYSSTGEFCLGSQRQTFAQWNNSSGEANSQQFSGTLVDPNRSLASYANSMGYASIDLFLAATQTLSRFNWQPSLTANAVNNYIKAGFALR